MFGGHFSKDDGKNLFRRPATKTEVKKEGGLFGMPPIPELPSAGAKSTTLFGKVTTPWQPAVADGAGTVSLFGGATAKKRSSTFAVTTSASSNVFASAPAPLFSGSTTSASPFTSAISTKPSQNAAFDKPDLFKHFSKDAASEQVGSAAPASNVPRQSKVDIFGRPISSVAQASWRPNSAVASSGLFASINPTNKEPIVDSTGGPVAGGVKSRLGLKRSYPTGDSVLVPGASSNEAVASDAVDDDPDWNEGSEMSAENVAEKRLEKLASREELKNIRSIVCEKVPQIALNKAVLEKHFSKFGPVSKITIMEAKKMAIIHFKDHKSARRAKEKGAFISSQIPKIEAIFYKKSRTLSSKTELTQPEELEEPGEMISTQKSSFMGIEATGELVKAEKTLPSQSLLDLQLQLEALMKKPAVTDAEKLLLLDARDKLLKERRAAQGVRAKLMGSCLDMCPEKERYSRISKNQLRFYEKLNGQAHHEAMIKEYSRSSADQDVPLPHDLRPPMVLSRTMDHLLCNVIDRVDNMNSTMAQWYGSLHTLGGAQALTESVKPVENIGEWFEFVWNATRAIRKDITQQDAADEVTVALVEKCARFHIMCAERLVEADSHDFDTKLNNENLTKCIQTLKHMYEDLRHQGVQCPNEPEFRAYEVLLNLNEGDILRSIDTLPTWVRSTEAMVLAVDVYSALNTNNYVRFFKLVERSSLLQSCLLLRYFDQVRMKALEIVTKAYCSGKNTVVFRLSRLSNMLAFEEPASCAKYCRLHGLETELESDSVYLERGSFQRPVGLPPVRRAVRLIESKLLTSWAVVINGNQPLPPNPFLTYQPHNSFDERGFLKPEMLMDLRPVPHESQVKAEWPPAPAAAPQQVVTDEQLLPIMEELCGQVVAEDCLSVTRLVMKTLHFNQLSTEFLQELMAEVLDEHILLVAKEAIKECLDREIEQRLKIEAQEAAMESISLDLVDEVCSLMSDQVAQDEIMEVKKQLQKEQLLSLAPDIYSDLYEEVAEKEIVQVAGATLKQMREELDQNVHLFQMKLQRRRLLLSFRGWLAVTRKQLDRQNILQNFACAPSFNSVSEQFRKLGSFCPQKQSFSDLLEKRRAVERLHDAIYQEDDIINQIIRQKIRLASLFESGHIRDFKLIIALPDVDSSEPSQPRLFCEMLKKKLMDVERPWQQDDPHLWSLYTDLASRICVCVRSVSTTMVQEEIDRSEKKRRDFLMGTNALLIVHLARDRPDDDLDTYRRLLDAFPPCATMPVCILTDSTQSELQVATKLGLTTLKQERKIGCYTVLRCSSNIFHLASLSSLQNSLQWLADNSSDLKPQALKCKSIVDFVQDFVQGQVLPEMFADREQRRTSQLASQHPNVLIRLFNEAVHHLVSTSQRSEVKNVSWPCPEIHSDTLKDFVPSYWNDDTYLEHVASILKSICLPDLSPRVFSATSWSHLVRILLEYLQGLGHVDVDMTFEMSRVSNVLIRSYRKLERCFEWTCFDESVAFYLPWTDLVHIFIDYRIKSMNPWDPFCKQKQMSKVAYFEHHLQDYKVPDFWKATLGWKAEKNLSMIARQIEESVRATDLSSSFHEASNLSKSLANERCASDRFEERLRSTLEPVIAMSGMDYSRTRGLSTDRASPDSQRSCPPSYAERALVRSVYVPIVSYLSPTLGQLASPFVSKQRFTFVWQSEEPKKKKQQRHPEDRFSHTATARPEVFMLRDSINQSLDKSIAFEDKLREAIEFPN